jgi:hypothetical protein
MRENGVMSAGLGLDEPTNADVIALVRAHLAGDAAAVDALLGEGERFRAMFAATTGLLIALLAGVLPGGPADLDEWLDEWQAQNRRSLLG